MTAMVRGIPVAGVEREIVLVADALGRGGGTVGNGAMRASVGGVAGGGCRERAASTSGRRVTGHTTAHGSCLCPQCLHRSSATRS